MPSRRPWIRPSIPGPRFLPVPIVGASCASSSACDTAAAAPVLEPHRSDATHREPARALYDDHHSQRLDHRRRSRSRAATPRDGNHSTQRVIDRDRLQNAAGLKLPPRRKQHVPASDTKSADSYLRSRTIPIAAPPCPPSRAFVQSGFNEVASEPSAAPSRLRDLTEPSRFPNRVFNDSWVVGFWRAGHGEHYVEVGR